MAEQKNNLEGIDNTKERKVKNRKQKRSSARGSITMPMAINSIKIIIYFLMRLPIKLSAVTRKSSSSSYPTIALILSSLRHHTTLGWITRILKMHSHGIPTSRRYSVFLMSVSES